jgi:hypothetical protein
MHGSDEPAMPARPVCRNHRREPIWIKSDGAGCKSDRRAAATCSAACELREMDMF